MLDIMLIFLMLVFASSFGAWGLAAHNVPFLIIATFFLFVAGVGVREMWKRTRRS